MPGRSWRRWLAVALTLGLVTTALAVGLGTWIASARGDDRLSVFESGDALSVLITSGPARLLIATGKNRTNFGNAFSETNPWTAPRLDILLVGGRGNQLTVPSWAAETFDPRWAAAIHPLAPTDAVSAFPGGLPNLPFSPTRFRLSERVTVIVETVARPGSDTAAFAWRALILRGRTVVAVLSDGEAYDLFAWRPGASAIIVTGDGAESVGERTEARAIVAPATRADLTALGGRVDSGDPDLYAVEVRPAEAVHLDFVDAGLRLPSSAVPLVRGAG